MSEAGRLNPVKARLKVLVETAYPLVSATNNWQEALSSIEDGAPVASIRIGVTGDVDVFGRRVDASTLGTFSEYPFTIHCLASNCEESGEDLNKYAQALADDVKDYLKTNASGQSAHNIYDISDLSERESQPERTRGYSRIIVSGRLLIKRAD